MGLAKAEWIEVKERGWTRHIVESAATDAIICEMGRIGSFLGTRGEGRAGSLEEVVCPQAPDEAHPRSLSAQYGLNALPFHAELSHRPRPCRYLVLGCIDPGSPSTATMLLDWRTIDLTREETCLL